MSIRQTINRIRLWFKANFCVLTVSGARALGYTITHGTDGWYAEYVCDEFIHRWAPCRTREEALAHLTYNLLADNTWDDLDKQLGAG